MSPEHANTPRLLGRGRLSIAVACLISWVAPTFAQDVQPPVSSRFRERHTPAIPDFQQHVVPMLGRLGCNSAKCHGSFQGRGDFRLSLFGFDFAADHAALLANASSQQGKRLDVAAPEDSLIVLKPTEQTDHEGGERFAKDSWEHHLLLRWIESGAESTREPRTIERLDVEPAEIIFAKPEASQPLQVIAVWSDGAREDVTCLCRFRTNNDSVVEVDADGRATCMGAGDTHIVVFYDNGVAAVPVMRRYSDTGGEQAVSLAGSSHPIDRLVAAKLAKLGLAPSKLCTDAEFLRRASIDITGTLPTPDEVEAFLRDQAPEKRDRKINELLNRPAYAAWWANKLCDFTGCSPTAFGEQTSLEVGYAFATQWYDWIYRRVAENASYEEIVQGIVLAKSRGEGQSVEDYAAEMSAYVRSENQADFSERATMPHYWTRTTLTENKDKALAFAHSFLGIQLQCAECHKHPFDKWTQEDFNDFTRFFEDVKANGRIGFPQFAAAQRGAIVGWPELSVSKSKGKSLSLLRSGVVAIPVGADPRRPLMDWLRSEENPWFARAFVNRVWAGYFHSGIVDPTDQFTPANPPSNPPLLDWLTQGFTESGYDMKWLHRQIAGSDAYQRSWRPNETNREDRRNFSRAIPRRIPAEVLYDALKQTTAATDQQEQVRNNLSRRASGHLSMRMAGTHAMRVFGKPERAINCDCERVNETTLLQSVFTQNDPLIRMRLAESGWIAEIEEAAEANTPVDRQRLIRLVWLRTVNRPPTSEEAARALQHLAATDSIAEGVGDLMWAMFNTKEFLLNH